MTPQRNPILIVNACARRLGSRARPAPGQESRKEGFAKKGEEGQRGKGGRVERGEGGGRGAGAGGAPTVGLQIGVTKFRMGGRVGLGEGGPIRVCLFQTLLGRKPRRIIEALV